MTSAFYTNMKCCLPLKSHSPSSAPSHTQALPGLKLQTSFTYTLVFYHSPCYYQSHSLLVKSPPGSLVLLWLLISMYWPLKENFRMKTQYGVPYKPPSTTCPNSGVLWRCMKKVPCKFRFTHCHRTVPFVPLLICQRSTKTFYPSEFFSHFPKSAKCYLCCNPLGKCLASLT